MRTRDTSYRKTELLSTTGGVGVLVIGSGGREHALAWKLAQSPRVERVFVAPGNGGTMADGESRMANVNVGAEDIDGLRRFARENGLGLTVVGPEVPLVAGIVDAFQAAGLRIFGPARAAAQLEGSKAFAKRFMLDEGIPTGQAEIFDEYDAALTYLRTRIAPIVIKASGLAAGKGVTVCHTMAEAEAALRAAMVERVFGAAGDEVLIEECLSGPEASLMAFSDGQTVVPMAVAQDHKAAFDGDQGPNTGGMGCYAPTPLVSPALRDEVMRTVIRPAVDGMWRRGASYVGVLYAGVILTDDGPKALEFNCRFGDPETQVVLPLLDGDLLDVLEACVDGRLAEVEVRWRDGYCVCVVLASKGYPGAYEKGKVIAGVDEAEALDDVVVFHAGARRDGEGRLLTDGGRVLGVTGLGATLPGAIETAYRAVQRIGFEGVHYRRDIGAKGVGAYAASGVNLAAAARAKQMMAAAVRSTYGPAVLAGHGHFGGLYDAAAVKGCHAPVLVASTDGVGTKTKIASAMGRFEPIGHDIVNHCVNDILVQGARPLFFLDYIAASRLDPEMVAETVSGIAAACRVAGCALLGGETAEMPGVYAPGEFDLAGAIVGLVERESVVDGSTIAPGDVLLGLPSSGLHTNGFSLARRALYGMSLDTPFGELGRTLGEALLEPHRSYLPHVERLWAAGVAVRGLAHITGGGFRGNVPRILPDGVGVRLDTTAWSVPPIFDVIQRRGGVDVDEMYRVFNMGVGMVVVVAPQAVDAALTALGEEAWLIGEVVAWDEGERVVIA